MYRMFERDCVSATTFRPVIVYPTVHMPVMSRNPTVNRIMIHDHQS
jgi:hypothetical protein